MNWKIYAQNPESCNEQGIYIKAKDEARPWQTETDAEEFDGFHNPSTEGWSVRDLESAKRFAEAYGLKGEVTEFELI